MRICWCCHGISFIGVQLGGEKEATCYTRNSFYSWKSVKIHFWWSPLIHPPINILGFCENSVSCTGLGAHLPPYVRKQVNPWEEGTSRPGPGNRRNLNMQDDGYTHSHNINSFQIKTHLNIFVTECVVNFAYLQGQICSKEKQVPSSIPEPVRGWEADI